jgi:DNA-binding transcriptional ArsR family regulator
VVGGAGDRRLLAGGERPVNDLVRLTGLAQPQVSKHLRVLREVGVVDVRDEGRGSGSRLNGPALADPRLGTCVRADVVGTLRGA